MLVCNHFVFEKLAKPKNVFPTRTSFSQFIDLLRTQHLKSQNVTGSGVEKPGQHKNLVKYLKELTIQKPVLQDFNLRN
jgi:hypothetical protein